MSIIQQIRERGAVLVIILIALSLIGFILMDSGKGGGGMQTPSDPIGSVNGTKISYKQFLDQTQQYEQYYQMQGRTVDDNTRQEINTQAWQTLVDGEILNQELGKLGIVVTDKEFDNVLYGVNAPDFLRREFSDPTTGAFDAAAARQAMSQLKKSGAPENKQMINDMYLVPLMENTVRTKYFSLLQNSNYLPKWMVDKTLADNNASANVSYVSVPYASVADSSVNVSDEAIMGYVKKHAAEYEVKEKSRSISYVTFSFAPTAADTAAALNELMNLKADFEATANPGVFVTSNASTLAFYDGYNSANRIQIAMKDSIISAGVGNVYGPYLDNNNYVLSRVVDVKNQADSVKARHILISTYNPSTQQVVLDDSTAKTRIDSIEAAIKGGANFASLATTLSNDEGSAIKGGDLGYFAPGAMVPEFNDFAFDHKTGEMGVVKTQFGYHLIQVMDQKNFAPAYKIAYLSREINAGNETINNAMNAANLFSGKSRGIKAFDKTVSDEKLSKLIAQEIKEFDYQIVGLGANRSLIKDIYKAEIGDVIEPVQLSDFFVVAAVTGEEKAGMPSVNKVRGSVENIVRNELKADIILKKIGTPTSLEDVASKQGQVVLTADSISFSSPMFGGMGYEPKVGGYAFNKNAVNKISAPIKGNNGVYILNTTAQFAKPNVGASSTEIIANYMQQQKSSSIYASLEGLRKAADLSDKRSKFL